jgi:hypothetical protein
MGSDICILYETTTQEQKRDKHTYIYTTQSLPYISHHITSHHTILHKNHTTSTLHHNFVFNRLNPIGRSVSQSVKIVLIEAAIAEDD